MSGGVPCAGELRFWSVVQTQLAALVKEVRRVADAIEARNEEDGVIPLPPREGE